MLKMRRSQAGDAVPIDRHLPARVLVDRQSIAAAGFLEGQQASANRRDDFGLTTGNPSLRRGRRKIGDGQWTSIEADCIFDMRTMRLGHLVTRI
jgi:hypothetical protein